MPELTSWPRAKKLPLLCQAFQRVQQHDRDSLVYLVWYTPMLLPATSTMYGCAFVAVKNCFWLEKSLLTIDIVCFLLIQKWCAFIDQLSVNHWCNSQCFHNPLSLCLHGCDHFFFTFCRQYFARCLNGQWDHSVI